MSSSIHDSLDALESVVARLAGLEPTPAHDVHRWDAIAERTGVELARARVLLLGPEAAPDAPELAARGALASVHEQGTPLAIESPPEGPFDIVLCAGLVHRTLDPLGLLWALRGLLAPNGHLIVGSMVLADLERSEMLRFVPDRHAGDPTWWFIPGRLAFRWMVQTAGFDVRAEFGERDGPRGNFAVRSVLLHAVAAISRERPAHVPEQRPVD